MQRSTAVSFSLLLFSFCILGFLFPLLLEHLLVLAGEGGTKRKTAYGLVGVLLSYKTITITYYIMPDGSWLSGRPSFFLSEIMNAFYYQSFGSTPFFRALYNVICLLYAR